MCLSVFFLGIDTDTDAGFHGTGLICNKCHTMHASENGVLPTMPGDTAPMTGPNPYLLYKANVTDLCLVCHDEQDGTPDVFGTDVNGLTERSAGFFAENVGVENPKGHNLGHNKIGPGDSLCDACHFGGDFNTAEIGCTDCHEAHGRDPNNPDYRYRNLQSAYIPGSEPIIKAFVNPSATGLAVYEQSNIGYPAPTTGTGDWREVTYFCLDCHHTFSGYLYTREDGIENGHPIKHPVTDTLRGAWEPIDKYTGSTDPEHWVNGIGNGFEIDRLPFMVSGATNYDESKIVAPNNEVFCLTCHKAHGSDYESAMRWDYRRDSNSGCQQCHNKG